METRVLINNIAEKQLLKFFKTLECRKGTLDLEKWIFFYENNKLVGVSVDGFLGIHEDIWTIFQYSFNLSFHETEILFRKKTKKYIRRKIKIARRVDNEYLTPFERRIKLNVRLNDESRKI
jgi:hypothetical protein